MAQFSLVSNVTVNKQLMTFKTMMDKPFKQDFLGVRSDSTFSNDNPLNPAYATFVYITVYSIRFAVE